MEEMEGGRNCAGIYEITGLTWTNRNIGQMQAKGSSYSPIWSAVNDAGGWTLVSAALGVKSAPDSTRAVLGRQRVSMADGRSSQGRHMILSG